MEITRRGGEESSKNELESSTLACCSYCGVVSHPSVPVRALNPVVTHSFGSPRWVPVPLTTVQTPHYRESVYLQMGNISAAHLKEQINPGEG